MKGNLKMFTNYSGHAMQWWIFLCNQRLLLCQWYGLKTDLCKWPPFKTDSRVQKAVKDRIKPEVSWESFKIMILYESGKLKVDPLTYMYILS